MSNLRGGATLSGMMDAHMDDDTLNIDASPTPDSNQENQGPKKKGAKAKATATKSTKAKVGLRRTSGASNVVKNMSASGAKPIRKRLPLKEQKNQQHADDTEEVDEFAAQTEGDTVMDDVPEIKAKEKKLAPAKKGGRPPKAATNQHVTEKQRDGEFEYTPVAGRTTKTNKNVEKVIQESQPSPETDPSMPPEQDQDNQEMPQSTFRRPTAGQNPPQRRRPLTIPRRRAGSASSTERPAGIGDAATRRKLGEMTRKAESLELKYRSLRETGIKEAEANFERLRTQSEAKAKAAHDLITSLKRELTIHKALSADTSTIQQQIGHRDADLLTLRTQAETLSTQLAEAQNENKALQAKLANSRSVAAAVESLGAKTPGSTALRARQQTQIHGGRTIMVGSAEAAQAAQVAQLKEDLYSDLTGLIIRGVESGADSDVYDCIQTGRNGTLHFHLTLLKDPDSSYEETVFEYTPRLDSNRDRDLIALLPEYLTDGLSFSRVNASMFYRKVGETLIGRRRRGEGEGDE